MPSRGVLALVILAAVFEMSASAAEQVILGTCVSQSTPEILTETTDLIRRVRPTILAARNWLQMIKPGAVKMSYDEGKLVDTHVATALAKIDKLEERVNGFLDPEIARYRASLLVHILVDLHDLRYDVAVVKYDLLSCTTCEVNEFKRVAAWVLGAEPLLASITDGSDTFRKAVAGVVHTLDCKPQGPFPATVRPHGQ